MPINTFFDRRIKNLIAAALAALVLFLLVETIIAIGYFKVSEDSSSSLNSIVVDGRGEATAIPNIATFSFTVREKAKTVADAQNLMSTKANKAIDYLKQNNVEDKDISTQNYNTSPQYDYSSGICTNETCAPSKSILTGYEVSETVEVKARDISKAGNLLAGIANVGVGEVSSLSLTVESKDELKAKARGDAIDKAKAQAQAIAEHLGVRLGKISSYYEDVNPPTPETTPYMMDEVDNQGASVPEIQPGEQKITSNVSITYEIKQR